MQLNIRKQPNQKRTEDLNDTSKEDIQMASKYMRRYSTLLITREMKVRTTTRYRTPSPKRLQTIKCSEGGRRKRFFALLWEQT